jgi:hypothetical protein
MLFTTNSANGPGPSGGQTVVLVGQGWGWANGQYANRAQALSGTPGGVRNTVHDASFDGCLNNTGSSITVTLNGWTDFNHGGVGHCPPAPAVGSVIEVPVIDQTTKNGGDTTCPQNGGYCAQVVAVAMVKITQSSIPGIVQGVLVGKVLDPLGIIDDGNNSAVQAAATSTPTATTIPTITPTSTSTPSGPSYSISPFAIYGTPQTSGSTQMLFAYGAPHYPSGDTVTLYEAGWGWNVLQYANRADGLAGVPSGVLGAASIHDTSFTGCLNSSQSSAQIGAWIAYNSQSSTSCTAPAVGSTLTIPVIDQTSTNCPQSGSACAHVAALVNVLIKDSSIPGVVDGLITGVVSDPSKIVETGRRTPPRV